MLRRSPLNVLNVYHIWCRVGNGTKLKKAQIKSIKTLNGMSGKIQNLLCERQLSNSSSS